MLDALAPRHLADVDEPLDTGLELDERAVIGEADDLAAHARADLEQYLANRDSGAISLGDLVGDIPAEAGTALYSSREEEVEAARAAGQLTGYEENAADETAGKPGKKEEPSGPEQGA